MNESILLSDRPEGIAKIFIGNKTIIIKKRFPKNYVGWVYIYCPKNGLNIEKDCGLGFPERVNNKVVARFWCDKVDKLETEFYKNEPLYDEGAVYQGVKRVCLEQLDYVDNDEEDCDREELYTNEIYENEEKNNKFLRSTCLTGKQLQDYFNNGFGIAYAIHISKLEIFDKPRELNTFKKKNDLNFWQWNDGWEQYSPLTKAPQNYCYIEI